MYEYFNANPKGTITKDCVIRAISTALNIDYYEVIDLLCKSSDYFNCDALVRDCYGKVLEDVFHLKKYTGNGKTVKELSDEHKNDILIIRIQNHLTCSKYGTILDIWNTSKEKVDVFWVVN